MLSHINAAEAQFRHESEMRMREHALLASIRERRAARSASIMETAAPPVAYATRPSTRATRAAWPRPIGIKNCEATVCAVA
ncbi:MAG TPA: hypothetical protein VEX42_06290 [Microbacterium sp.]|nr:hypothetical protein [Microbacterium sp.]